MNTFYAGGGWMLVGSIDQRDSNIFSRNTWQQTSPSTTQLSYSTAARDQKGPAWSNFPGQEILFQCTDYLNWDSQSGFPGGMNNARHHIFGVGHFDSLSSFFQSETQMSITSLGKTFQINHPSARFFVSSTEYFGGPTDVQGECNAFIAIRGSEASLTGGFRSGNLRWEAVGPWSAREIKFFLEFDLWSELPAWKNKGVNDQITVGTFHYGDGTSETVKCVIQSVFSTDDVYRCAATVTHQYIAASTDSFTAYIEECCRVGSILNQGSSSKYRLATKVAFSIVNKAPSGAGIHVIRATAGAETSWFVPATDPDGDSLVYSLGTASDMQVQQPQNIAVDSLTGQVTWTAPALPAGYSSALFSSQVLVQDKSTTVPIDYLIEIRPRPSNICKGSSCTDCNTCDSNSDCSCGTCQPIAGPQWVGPSPWITNDLGKCFVPATTVSSFEVKATDADGDCDFVTIETTSNLPSGATFTEVNAPAKDMMRLSWNPSVNQAGDHKFCFVARDKFGLETSLECVTITVPAVSALEPDVEKASPAEGDAEGGTPIVVTGTGFQASTELKCRFRGAQTFVSSAIFISSTQLMCITPASSKVGNSNTIAVDVANIGSCDIWVEALATFTYTASCPPGTGGPNCQACGAGRYQAGGGQAGTTQCTDCPAGRYGATPGLSSSDCTGPCSKGYYCPAGSTTPQAKACPAGTIGDQEGLASPSCAGPCPAGYYCPAGTTTPTKLCPAGYFGGVGESTQECSGKCSPGYWCEQGSTSSTQHQCGGNAFFCPEGSVSPRSVQTGFYTTGGDVATRTGETECEPGSFCVDGVKSPCLAGYYGSESGMTNNLCSGQCSAGFICAAGSSSPTAVACGEKINPPANFFCPPGSSSPTRVSSGHYSLPESAPKDQRTGQSPCTEEYVCRNGERLRKLQIISGCDGGSTVWQVDENTGNVEVGSMVGRSNVIGSEIVDYRLRNVAPIAVDGVVTCNVQNPFTRDENKIRLTQAIDHEKCPGYTMDFVLISPGISVETVCAVRVDIVDVNEPPELLPSYSLTIPENSPNNALVGDALELFDEDQGQEHLFEIISGDTNAFQISPCSGQISVNQPILNFETKSSYNLRVRVTDDGIPPLSDEAEVVIQIMDVPEPPTFDKNQVTLEVPELAPVGTEVTPDAVSASDEDVDATLTYRVTSDTGAFFSIDDSGVLRTKQVLDFEAASEYSLVISVEDDSGFIITRTVIVNVLDRNDAPIPAFPRTDFTLPETAAGGTLIAGNLPSSDQDRPGQTLTYTILAPNDSVFSLSRVSATSFSLSLAAGTTLDYETKSEYTIDLEISDDGTPPQTVTTSVRFLVGDVNEKPTLVQDTRRVDENAPVGTPVGAPLVATDPDIGQNLFFSIDGASPYTIDPATGQLRVGTPNMDFETPSQRTTAVKVIVRDNGSPVLSDSKVITVELNDVNEPPFFSASPVLSLPENPSFPTNTSGGPIMASDYEGDNLFYSILPGRDGARFTIVNLGGGGAQLQTLDGAEYDFEKKSRLEVLVSVTDGVGTGQGTVYIDLEDVNETPWLPYTNLFVAALSPSGTVLKPKLQGMDVDANDVLTYSIHAYNSTQSEDLFTLSASGDVSLKMDAPSNTQQGRMFFGFTVRVQDQGGLSSIGYVEVDIAQNNAAPVLNDATFNMPENTQPLSKLVDLVATDENTEQILTYEIVSTTPPGMERAFIIKRSHPSTLSLGLDRLNYEYLVAESNPTIQVEVMVQDNGIAGPDGDRISRLSDTATVTINVQNSNDAPVLPQFEYSIDVREDTTDPLIFTFTAFDEDGDPVRFALARENSDASKTAGEPFPFTVDSVSGELDLSGAIDHETRASYSCILTVTDVPSVGTALQATARVLITIVDVNEAPVGPSAYSFDAPENALPFSVGQIVFTDEDTGLAGLLKYSIVEGNINNAFRISPEGAIDVQREGGLDFEDVAEYDLVVSVSDSDQTDAITVNTSVTISVLDLNDVTVSAVDFAQGFTDGEVGPDDRLLYPTEGAPSALIIRGTNLGYTNTISGRTQTNLRGKVVFVPTGFTAAVDCEQTTPGVNTEIICDVPPGVGQATWSLQQVESQHISTSRVSTHYIAPKITEVEGAAALPTAGGATVILSGTNFGPPNTPVVVSYGPQSRYQTECTDPCDREVGSQGGVARVPHTDYVLLSSVCTVTTAHTKVSCASTVGLGTGLGWFLIVGAQRSPRFVGSTTSYAVPTVTGVEIKSTNENSPAPAFLATAGGNLLVVSGTNFGAGKVVDPFGQVMLHYKSANGPTYSTSCNVSVAHSQLRCFSVAGVGKELLFSVAVGKQHSAFFQSSISYSPPVITSVTGGQKVTTEGGSEVVLRGTSFGIQAGDLLEVRYGKTPDSGLATDLKYQAVDCQVTVPHKEVKCATAPGTGKDHFWAIRSDDQWSALFASSTSYHPPLVEGFDGVGATAARTEGGDTVTVRGRNFGPADNDVEVLAVYSKPLEGSAGSYDQTFVADCEVLDHTRLRCTCGEGAGTNLLWTITIDGQQNVRDSTTYDPPVITSIFGPASSGVASTQGNQRVFLGGENFGPEGGEDLEGKPYLEWVRYGPTGMEYPAVGCRVLNHTLIECTTVPAVGEDLFWLVRIRGQTSTRSPSWSHAPPVIASYISSMKRAQAEATGEEPEDLSAVGYTSGEQVTLIGTNFGVNVTVAQAGFAIADAVAGGARTGNIMTGGNVRVWLLGGTQNALKTLTILGTRTRNSGEQEIDVILPPGVGTGYSLQVEITPVYGGPVVTSESAVWDYSAPMLNPSVGVEEINTTAMIIHLQGYSFCEPPPFTVTSDADDNVTPRNGPVGTTKSMFDCGFVELLDSTNPQNEGGLVRWPWYKIIEHEHNSIKLYGPKEGSLRVVVAGQASETVQFQATVPIIAAREDGKPAYEPTLFHTDGGEILTIYAENICFAADLRILVGKEERECYLPQEPQPTEGNEVECKIECRMPRGDGISEPLVMVTSQRGPAYTIDFYPPAIQNASIHDEYFGDELEAAWLNIDNLPRDGIIVRVPTEGGALFLDGADFGASPFTDPFDDNCDFRVPPPPTPFNKSSSLRLYGTLPIPDTIVSHPVGAPAERSCGINVPAKRVLDIDSNQWSIEASIPEGSGQGYMLELTVSGQPSTTFVRLDYHHPLVEGVSPTTGPTEGGYNLTITGAHFGSPSAGSSIKVWIGSYECPVLEWSHHEIVCAAPAGQGHYNRVLVNVDDQVSCTDTTPLVDPTPPACTPNTRSCQLQTTSCNVGFHYDAPEVHAVVMKDVNGEVMADYEAATAGGQHMWIVGKNFGVSGPKVHLAPTSARMEYDLAYLVDVNQTWFQQNKNSPEGQAVPARRSLSSDPAATPFYIYALDSTQHNGWIQYFNHTHIMLTVPQGQGLYRSVRVSVGPLLSDYNPQAKYAYAAPSLQTPVPGEDDSFLALHRAPLCPLRGSTKGYYVRVHGRNFGRVEPLPQWINTGLYLNSDLSELTYPHGGTPVAPALKKEDYSDLGFGIGGAPKKAVGYNGRGGLSVTVLPGSLNAIQCIAGRDERLRQREFEAWRSRCLASSSPDAPDDLGSTVSLAPLSPLDFPAPEGDDYIFCLMPQGFGEGLPFEVSLDGRSLQGSSELNLTMAYLPPRVDTVVPSAVDARFGEEIQARGENYGNDTFNSVKNVVSFDVGDYKCLGVSRREATEHTRLTCTTQSDLVGPKNITIKAGGQTRSYPTFIEPDITYRIQLQCEVGYYGQNGEICVPCPLGAQCDGPVCEEYHIDGSLLGTCKRYREPYSLEGFFRVNLPANTAECPTDRADRQVSEEHLPELVGTCPVFLPCEPTDACLGNNTCATGYTGERCSQCLLGYYRVGGECEQCPDTAWILILVGLLLVIGVCVGVYYLSRIMSMALVTIGVDYLQVLALFAASKVQWPSFISSLLNLLSAFNINLDLVAPECTVPDLGFEFKWAILVSAPLMLAAGLTVAFGFIVVFKMCWRKQRFNAAATHINIFISLYLIAVYFAYLFLARTIFDVFNCSPTTPPGTLCVHFCTVLFQQHASPSLAATADGKEYMQAVIVECYKEGGLHMRLLPWAILACIGYVVGFPLFVIFVLARNKEKVKADQILRAHGLLLSSARLGTPLYEFHRRYRRLYQYMKPGKW